MTKHSFSYLVILHRSQFSCGCHLPPALYCQTLSFLQNIVFWTSIFLEVEEKMESSKIMSPIEIKNCKDLCPKQTSINCFRSNRKPIFADCVWQWSWLDQTQKSKKILSKSTLIFLLISHQSLFITIQIKKSLQNKIFHFFIQDILTFFLKSIKFATVPIHFLKSIPLPNIAVMNAKINYYLFSLHKTLIKVSTKEKRLYVHID